MEGEKQLACEHSGLQVKEPGVPRGPALRSSAGAPPTPLSVPLSPPLSLPLSSPFPDSPGTWVERLLRALFPSGPQNDCLLAALGTEFLPTCPWKPCHLGRQKVQPPSSAIRQEPKLPAMSSEGMAPSP